MTHTPGIIILPSQSLVAPTETLTCRVPCSINSNRPIANQASRLVVLKVCKRPIRASLSNPHREHLANMAAKTIQSVLLQKIKDRFGYESLNKFQQDVVLEAIRRSDSFLSVKAGGGRIVCFQCLSVVVWETGLKAWSPATVTLTD